MKNMNLTNLTLAIFGLLAVAFFGINLVEAKGLGVVGPVVAYVTVTVIFVVAGGDNTRAKKLV
jgi:hypothetical protein